MFKNLLHDLLDTIRSLADFGPFPISFFGSITRKMVAPALFLYPTLMAYFFQDTVHQLAVINRVRPHHGLCILSIQQSWKQLAVGG